MVYLYLKALHVIFVVTWFAGLFYMPRLFIYNTEAAAKPGYARAILHPQFKLMMKRLWYGITWPSAIITLGMGLWVLVQGGWHKQVFAPGGEWLLVKLVLVLLLYAYHISLQVLYAQQQRDVFALSSQQLRLWNEVATVFLVAIVMLVVVKQNMSLLWGLGGLLALIALLLAAIKIYKRLRKP